MLILLFLDGDATCAGCSVRTLAMKAGTVGLDQVPPPPSREDPGLLLTSLCLNFLHEVVGIVLTF